MSARASFNDTLVLPRALDLLARDHPKATWMTVPTDSSLNGWRNITYGELSQAVDGFALWAESTVESCDVVAYMGINDVRYAAAEMGTIKMGRTILLPSPRNSHQGNASVLAASGCSTLIYSESMGSHITALRLSVPTLRMHMIPSFDHLCHLGAALAYRNQCRLDEDAPAIILQTSGSTGVPRPITITNGGIATFKHVSDLSLPPELQERPSGSQEFGRTLFSMAPFFHEAGTILIVRSILCRGPAILPPPDKPPTAELILSVIVQTRPSIIAIFPSVLEDLVRLPGGLDALAQVDMVTFGGAPLNQEIGDKVSKVTFLYSGIGSTEAGVLATQLPRDRSDWNYCAWSPASGVDMERRDDGLWECVIKPVDRRYQRIFHTYPHIKEYRTKDLFEQHATKPGLWRFHSRADDVLILSNGEKLNPVEFEKRVEQHPWVNGAIVIGQSKFQTSLLIEVKWELVPVGIGTASILEEVWPAVDQANHTVPKHGIVWWSMVAIGSREKPFTRTSTKGNIIKVKTAALYSSEIEALYADGASGAVQALMPDAGPDEIGSFLRSAIQAVGLPLSETSDDQDLFALGMDSLQALHLSSIISRSAFREVTPAEVYGHPSIAGLTKYLEKGEQTPALLEDSERIQAMRDMVEKYTQHMIGRPSAHDVHQPRSKDHSVLLTGSTGNLGCLLLQELIRAPDITQIFALNRAANGLARQSQRFTELGLEIEFSKVTFLHSVDFSQQLLGLSSGTYDQLLEAIDLIILNAWTVDFNKTLASFESLVAGTRRFVDLSIASQRQAHIVLISSVASVGNWSSVCGGQAIEVPESVIPDDRVPAPNGYGESKHVASLVLAAAAEVGVSSTVIRVGQLAGLARENSLIEWNRREWIPNLIASSKVLRLLPERLGGLEHIDWVPIDLAAKAIIEIGRTVPYSVKRRRVLHVVNPQTTTWQELVPTMQACLEQRLGKDVPIVPYSQWLTELKGVSRTKENAERVPGIRLLSFYEGLIGVQGNLRLATNETIKLSPEMSELRAIDARLMEGWVRRMEG